MPTTKPSPKSPRKPVQERGHNTVATIIGAARALLRRMPLDDITTARIARKARISIGGLYRFFPDKQSILDAIAVHHVHMFRLLTQRPSSARCSPSRKTSPPSIPPSSSTP